METIVNGYTIVRHKRTRFWAILTPAGDLITVTVYKRGACYVAGILPPAEIVQ